MNSSAGGQVVVPRNFRLLAEYDASVGKEGSSLITHPHVGFISYGLENAAEDRLLHNWTGLIIGPQGSHIGEFMFNLVIYVPIEYPNVPPQIRFTGQKVAMRCVDSSGNVNVAAIETEGERDTKISGSGGKETEVFAGGRRFEFNPKHNVADVLMALRSNMHSSKVSQALRGPDAV
eukprot:TRINITY_DN3608_c0_g1_i1.p1 TRINITY_DN3608_c0_g1~~TRINITY_DN3608_c0_g1_i1.p1  ORF type:complete len:176 (-),score=21.85 TRINITY_DN3608_c0_g1_i1:22-549(-)